MSEQAVRKFLNKYVVDTLSYIYIQITCDQIT